jgi:hypothetical protein
MASAGCHVTGKHGVDSLFEHSFAKLGVFLGTFKQGGAKSSGKSHDNYLLSFPHLVILPASVRR